MKLIKQITFMLFAVVLAACASSSGTKIDDAQLNKFQRGKTTYNDVVNAVGTPSSTTTMADGSRMAFYNYTSTQTHTAAFIPFAGGSRVDAKTGMVSFTFGPNGVLKDYSSTQNNLTQ